jgi:hypothetical protein
MSSSWAVSIRPSVSCRVSKAEYSAWTASIRATMTVLGMTAGYDARYERQNYVLELALRRVLAEHSDRPMYFVFPSLRMESRAGIDDSRGVSACFNHVSILIESIVWAKGRLTRIDAVKVVKIRSESKAFDRSLDVGLDVFGGVGDGHVFEY